MHDCSVWRIPHLGYALDDCSLREGVGTARPLSRRARFPGDGPSPPLANYATGVKCIALFRIPKSLAAGPLPGLLSCVSPAPAWYNRRGHQRVA